MKLRLHLKDWSLLDERGESGHHRSKALEAGVSRIVRDTNPFVSLHCTGCHVRHQWLRKVP